MGRHGATRCFGKKLGLAAHSSCLSAMMTCGVAGGSAGWGWAVGWGGAGASFLCPFGFTRPLRPGEEEGAVLRSLLQGCSGRWVPRAALPGCSPPSQHLPLRTPPASQAPPLLPRLGFDHFHFLSLSSALHLLQFGSTLLQRGDQGPLHSLISGSEQRDIISAPPRPAPRQLLVSFILSISPGAGLAPRHPHLTAGPDGLSSGTLLLHSHMPPLLNRTALKGRDSVSFLRT